MADMNLTQPEADALLAMEKHRIDDVVYDFPSMGGVLTIALQSPDRREQFLLDMRKGRVDLLKGTYQSRARSVVVLARLDFGGAAHRNPDDTEVACPHLHLYREGYGDKWAFPLPAERFAASGDQWNLFQEFMIYCNITRQPIIQRGFFA